MKKAFLRNGVFLIAFMAGIISLHAQSNKSSHSTKSPGIKNKYLSVENDNSADPGQQIVDYRDGQHYQLKLTNDKLTELIVDGKKIAPADFYKFEPVLKKIREQIKKDQEMAELDSKQAAKDREQAETDEVQAGKDAQQAEKDNEQADEDRKAAEEDRKQANEDRQQADKDHKQADEDRKQAEEDRQQAMKDREQANMDREQAMVDKKHADEDELLVKNLINDLIKEKIIANDKDLFTLVLKDGELSVNDKKQQEDVYKKFKTKYLKNLRTKIQYSNTYQHRGLSIYTEDNKQ